MFIISIYYYPLWNASYVPGTRREILPMFYKILTKPFKYYYFLSLVYKETDTEKLGNLPNATQILNGRASSGKFGSKAIIPSTAISAGLGWSWALVMFG